MVEPYRFRLGPDPISSVAPGTTAAKFWNMASVSEDEGEITLYGDVLSRQPVDWWTGEPEPGLYITPEGFMEDLAAVKGKQCITVRLNSCGGDLYTGIAIHNALKALTGEVHVIVEGIAASAASVIMCAGDRINVYPGSLVMIHGVSAYFWGSLNIQDMKQLMKGMDASERAVAEIYNAKTGIAVDTLRSMMTKETWLTGREAVEKGFADQVLEGEGEPDMGMSPDRRILYVNGIGHNVEGLQHIPGTIPVLGNASPVTRPVMSASPSHVIEQTKGGKKYMTLEELKGQESELVKQIEQEARNAAQIQASADAVAEERKRLEDIDSIAASVPDPKMVQEAKYGKNPCTAQELCFRVMQASAAQGMQFLEMYKSDGAASGADKVGAAPNSGAPINQNEEDAADIQAVVNAYKNSRGGVR